MQIIDKNDCYVSKDDLNHLYDNDIIMPISLQLGLRDAIINEKDYVKITDEKAIEYIYSSDIPSFDDLYQFKVSDLKQKIFRIVIEESFKNYASDDLSLHEIIKEKRNREYMILQLKEMIAFKKREKIKIYPDIPFPYVQPIANDKYRASLSYNNDKVIIYCNDGINKDDDIDIDFCKEAVKLLTADASTSRYDIRFDGNYFIVKAKEKEYIKEKMIECYN